MTKLLFLFSSFLFFPSLFALQINNKIISKKDLQKRLKKIKKLNPGNIQDAKNEIINFELAIQEARKYNLHKEEETAKKIDLLLYQSYLDRFLSPKLSSLKIPKKAIREYFLKRPEIHTRTLSFLKREKSGVIKKTKIAKLNKIQKKALARPLTFEKLVRKHSEDHNAHLGGDAGFGGENNLLPEYYKQALLLKPGQISPVFESPYGYHIIQLIKRKKWKMASPQYKDYIREKIKKRKAKKLYREHFAKLQKKALIKE